MFTNTYYRSLAIDFDPKQGNNVNYPIKNYQGGTRDTSSLYAYRGYIGTAIKNFCTSHKSSNAVGTSVAFGDGNTSPTPDDYCLSGNHFTTYTGMYSCTYDYDTNTTTVTYTLQNSGSSDFTIREVGLYCTPNQYYYTVLILREVLDEPVTIPAGGVGMVTLNLKVALQTS